MAQSLEEESPGGGGVAVLGQQHVDDLAIPVDRPVQVTPPELATDVPPLHRLTAAFAELALGHLTKDDP